MSELTMDRLRENLESLKMKNTLEILDNYLERAVAEMPYNRETRGISTDLLTFLLT